MSSLSRELVFLILQFLDEEKYKDTVSSLERESGVYFNMKHFEDLVLNGEWDAVEKYIAGFTRLEDNRYSMKIYFEIRKQKYLEALDRRERGKAAEILMKDLKVFASFNEELFKEITHLITLEDFRQNEQLSKYGDTKSARSIMLVELKKLVDANPLFRDKLLFPPLRASRLRSLINQSLNWQHQLCKNPLPNPDIKTLFTDHTCAPSSGARAPPPVNGPTIGPLSKGVAFQTATPHGMLTVQPIQQAVSPSSTLGGWMATLNPSVVPSPLSTLPPPNTVSFMKHPRTNAALDYQADSEQILKRIRSSHPDEVLFSGPVHHPNVYSHDDLPRTTVRTLQQGSSITSFDFHPQQHTVLLVGTSIGDISIWEVGTRERLTHRGFKIWDTSVCPVSLQAALMKDPSISVNRCRWSPDGSIVGAAFSKHLIHTYFFGHNGELRPQLEIDAHIGGVNDLAFAYPNKSLLIISCGDDKTIKVWNASTGQREHIFEGHNAPVYSICPHSKENINFIFSTAFDGKIKAWLYDCAVPRVDYDAPGLACTVMAYSSDGSRLFSCGSGKEGDSHLVEWSESEGTVKRSYSGFRKRSPTMVQFDTTRNRILAAGDDFMIKFWDMDSRDVVATTEADGGLAGSPRLKFNKDGSLLAVSTIDNGFKILANTDGLRIIRLLESRAYEGSRGSTQQINSKVHLAGVPHVSVTIATTADKMLAPVQAPALNTAENSRTSDLRPRVTNDSEKLKGWKLADVVDPKQLKAITLPDSATSGKIMRLLFTNSGSAVLALSSNAMHKLWKWQCTDKKMPPKCTPSVLPQLWQPASGITMSNDTTDINTDDPIACVALSKNDSYIMSASGGKVSLYNMISFKVMTSFMLPPPTATFLAFHPVDNNILAIGMDDSTILIYNVRVDEVKSTLKAHQKRITGLAFSQTMNVLVSSGTDTQLCMWSINGWEKKKSRFIKSSVGRTSSLTGDTSVQFNNDQTRILVSHETQLAIYDSNFDCLLSWMPRETLPAAISCGVYSSDGALIYAGFADGAVGVFHSESLSLCCRIAPSSYARGTAYPTVIAVHPGEANQIAVGMSDGVVHLMEPADTDTGTASSTHASDAALSR